MKKSRFTEEQIAYALRLAEGGTPVADVCRQIGISDATFVSVQRTHLDSVCVTLKDRVHEGSLRGHDGKRQGSQTAALR